MLNKTSEGQGLVSLAPVPEEDLNGKKSVSWKGRKLLLGTSYGLFATASLEAAGAVFNYLGPEYLQIMIPRWVVVGFGVGMATMTLIGGCCLYCNIPDEEIQDAVDKLEGGVNVLANETTKLGVTLNTYANAKKDLGRDIGKLSTKMKELVAISDLSQGSNQKCEALIQTYSRVKYTVDES